MSLDQTVVRSDTDNAVIKVLLVDDHPLIRQAVRTVLEKEADIDIVGEAGNGEDAVEMARKLQPEVIIMDVSMPRMNGIAATRQIKGLWPQMAVLILTVHDDDQNIREIMDAGAGGYLIKSVFGKEIVQAVRSLASGDMVLSPVIGKHLVNQAARHPIKPVRLEAGEKLSPHEMEILKLTATGMANKEIAAALGLTLRTVKGHLADIFAKLHVDSRTEAVIVGLKAGFLSIEDLK
jgi:two-component system, NarL family, response regulator LiaR